MSAALNDVSRRTLTAGDRERADIILALGQLLKAWMTSRSESNWNWSKVRKLIRNRVTSL
jgi:hypothetical protein